MSLLITSNTPKNDIGTEVVGINRPFSYRNNLNDTIKIPEMSKIAVQSVKINRSGNITINRSTQFGIYFGEEIPAGATNPESVLSITGTTYILEENENSFTGNMDNIASKLQIAGNKALWHPNLCKNASLTLNPGFTCVPRRNASSLDYLGFSMTLTNTDKSKNQSLVSSEWLAAADYAITGNLVGNTLTNGVANPNAFIGTDYPLSLANGSFITELVSNTNYQEIGLVRNQPKDLVDIKLLSPDYSAASEEDFFDWNLTINTGGDISIFHAVPGFIADQIDMEEINYGATINAATLKISEVRFNVQGERVKISVYSDINKLETILITGTSGTSASNAKPVAMTTRWLFPKIYLEAGDSIKIKEFSAVNVADWSYDWENNNNLEGKDWYLYHYMDLGNTDLAQRIDTTFAKILNRIDQIGLNGNSQIDYKPTLFFAPDNRYLLTDSLNAQRLFGFPGRSLVNVPNSTAAGSPFTLTFLSDEAPELTSKDSLFIRLKNFTITSTNFAKSANSKIIYHIPSFANNGDSVGTLYFEPQERVYLDLNNVRPLFISDIEVDIVHDDETLAVELQGKTTVCLHISK